MSAPTRLDTAPEQSAQSEADAALAELGYAPSLRRSLGMGGLLVYGLLFFVPMAPIATYGMVINRSGGLPILTYLVAAAVMGLSAISYAQMARRFPVAGSVYGYARLSAGPWLGFFAGWAILLDYVLMPGLLTILSAVALAHSFPAVPPTVFAVLFIGTSMLMNLRGMELTTRVGLVLLGIQLATIALFVGFVLTDVAAGRLSLSLDALWHPGASLTAVLPAVSLAAFSYLGFDAVNTLNEDAKGGGRAVARATTVLLGAITALFCLQLWAASLVTGVGGFGPGAATNRAFYGAVDQVAPAWYVPVFTLTNAFVAIFACLVVAHAASARLLFAMARDRELPGFLSRTSGRGVPHTATLAVGAVAVLVAVPFIDHPEIMSLLVTFGAMASYVVLHACVVRRFWVQERSGRWVVHLLVPVAGAAALLVTLSRTSPVALRVGLVWFAAGVIVHLVRKHKAKES